MQMLEKDPRNRPANLADVRRRLLPFATRGANTADIGRRFAAFFIDYGFANTILVSFAATLVVIVGALFGLKSDLAGNQGNVTLQYSEDNGGQLKRLMSSQKLNFVRCLRDASNNLSNKVAKRHTMSLQGGWFHVKLDRWPETLAFFLLVGVSSLKFSSS